MRGANLPWNPSPNILLVISECTLSTQPMGSLLLPVWDRTWDWGKILSHKMSRADLKLSKGRKWNGREGDLRSNKVTENVRWKKETPILCVSEKYSVRKQSQLLGCWLGARSSWGRGGEAQNTVRHLKSLLFWFQMLHNETLGDKEHWGNRSGKEVCGREELWVSSSEINFRNWRSGLESFGWVWL